MTTQRKWREWLTKHLLALWLKDGRYRGPQFVTGDHQNAEYRICVDARIATDAPVDIVVAMFSAIVAAAVFTNVLWAVGGSLTLVVSGHPVTIPGYLAQRSPVWLALHQVLDRWRQLLWQLMGTTMVSQMDLLFAPAFAWVLCAPKYLDGTMPLGELT
jgi:vitamin B12/bleomycin/antimicrobial peptide transport system ATP-binding/permease protein